MELGKHREGWINIGITRGGVRKCSCESKVGMDKCKEGGINVRMDG